MEKIQKLTFEMFPPKKYSQDNNSEPNPFEIMENNTNDNPYHNMQQQNENNHSMQQQNNNNPYHNMLQQNENNQYHNMQPQPQNNHNMQQQNDYNPYQNSRKLVQHQNTADFVPDYAKHYQQEIPGYQDNSYSNNVSQPQSQIYHPQNNHLQEQQNMNKFMKYLENENDGQIPEEYNIQKMNDINQQAMNQHHQQNQNPVHKNNVYDQDFTKRR